MFYASPGDDSTGWRPSPGHRRQRSNTFNATSATNAAIALGVAVHVARGVAANGRSPQPQPAEAQAPQKVKGEIEQVSARSSKRSPAPRRSSGRGDRHTQTRQRQTQTRRRQTQTRQRQTQTRDRPLRFTVRALPLQYVLCSGTFAGYGIPWSCSILFYRFYHLFVILCYSMCIHVLYCIYAALHTAPVLHTPYTYAAYTVHVLNCLSGYLFVFALACLWLAWYAHE